MFIAKIVLISSKNGTRGKEGDNHVYFGVSHHFYFEPS